MDGQLKRGMLDVCVLAAIRKEDSYGYQILKDLRPYVAPDRVHAVVQLSLIHISEPTRPY